MHRNIWKTSPSRTPRHQIFGQPRLRYTGLSLIKMQKPSRVKFLQVDIIQNVPVCNSHQHVASILVLWLVTRWVGHLWQRSWIHGPNRWAIQCSTIRAQTQRLNLPRRGFFWTLMPTSPSPPTPWGKPAVLTQGCIIFWFILNTDNRKECSVQLRVWPLTVFYCILVYCLLQALWVY